MSDIQLIRYQEQLNKYLEPLKRKGFDSIRFPGGTSKNGRNSAFVIYMQEFAHEKYYLVLPYQSSFHQREKINLVDKYEGPKNTAVREFKEEVRVKIDANFLESYYVVLAEDNSNRKKTHKKYFYKYKQEIAEFLEYSLDFETEDVEETTTPFFIKNTLLRGNLFWKHYEVFKNGWRKKR